MKLRPLCKTWGGKWYLKDWIISNFPADYQSYAYCEPFVGGGNILLTKKRSFLFETINDLDSGLIEIWRAVQDNWPEFQHQLSLLTYSQETFDRALMGYVGTWAVNEYVLRRMSRGGMKKAFAWSERLRRGKPGDVSGWETALEQLPAISERLQGVDIQNVDAKLLLVQHGNNPNCLFYLDSPYFHSTRKSKKAYGDFEMTDAEHAEMANIVTDSGFKAKVLISGYDCPEYRCWYSDWDIAAKEIVNHAAQNKTKRKMTELVFRNY